MLKNLPHLNNAVDRVVLENSIVRVDQCYTFSWKVARLKSTNKIRGSGRGTMKNMDAKKSWVKNVIFFSCAKDAKQKTNDQNVRHIFCSNAF